MACRIHEIIAALLARELGITRAAQGAQMLCCEDWGI